MWEDFYKLVTTPPAKGRPPVPHGHAYYVLIEALGGDQEEDASRFERVLAAELENGEIADAAIAKSKDECARLWALRDDVLQVGQNAPIFTFDVSLTLGKTESYIEEVRDALEGALAGDDLDGVRASGRRQPASHSRCRRRQP